MWRRIWRRLTATPPEVTLVEDTPQGKLYLAMSDHCPSCHLKPPAWKAGPSGGMSINVFCGGCGQGYNITPATRKSSTSTRDTS
jgi:hypothetical protein